jgi:hypothetical protein
MSEVPADAARVKDSMDAEDHPQSPLNVARMVGESVSGEAARAGSVTESRDQALPGTKATDLAAGLRGGAAEREVAYTELLRLEVGHGSCLQGAARSQR